MDKFVLSQQHIDSVEQILADSEINISDIPSLIRKGFDVHFHEDDLWELSDLIKSFFSDSLLSPLFASNKEKEKLVAFHQNFLVFKSFLSEIEWEAENIENVMLDSSRYDDLKKIKNGEHLITILGDKFLTLCFSKYGFNDAFEMAYAIGAYIENKIQYRDKRNVTIKTDSGFYSYDNHSHGDFRLYKYQCDSFTSVDPIDNKTIYPFGYNKCIGAIAGYHSIETYILSDFLGALYLSGQTVEVVDNFEDYINKLKEQGQSFGCYADAGMYDSTEVTMGFSGLKYNRLQEICTESENDTFYLPEFVNNEIIFYKKKHYQDESNNIAMRIPISDINELIIGLFKKVSLGNGRSSIIALEDTMNYYRVKYCSVNYNEVVFNSDVGEIYFSR